MKITEIELRRLDVPLVRPYVVSTRVIRSFDPLVVGLRTEDGQQGWGEVLIAPGYTNETLQGSIDTWTAIARDTVGQDSSVLSHRLEAVVDTQPGIASAILSALAMLEYDPLLVSETAKRVPLLVPVQSEADDALPAEIERLLAAGFTTLKVKVGFDWQEDLRRVNRIQSLVRGRAVLRLDANRGYDLASGLAMATRLNPEGIELFEQPCGSDDWQAHAVIGMSSTVPLMLDESIYGLADIERSGAIKGVGFIKLKLKKMGSPRMLANALNYIRAHGMEPVLGDGVATDMACWAEACVATDTIRNAGEMNGYLKLSRSVFRNPLPVQQGAIVIPAGYWPEMDHEVLDAFTVSRQVLHA